GREPGDRPQGQVGGQDEGGGGEVPGAGQHADRGGAPDGGGGVDAADVDAVAQDDPGAEEPDAGHDVGGDPGRVDPMLPGQQDGEQLEQGGAESDQSVRAQSGGA